MSHLMWDVCLWGYQREQRCSQTHEKPIILILTDNRFLDTIGLACYGTLQLMENNPYEENQRYRRGLRGPGDGRLL